MLAVSVLDPLQSAGSYQTHKVKSMLRVELRTPILYPVHQSPFYLDAYYDTMERYHN